MKTHITAMFMEYEPAAVILYLGYEPAPVYMKNYEKTTKSVGYEPAMVNMAKLMKK